MGTLVPTIGNAIGAVAPVISTAQTAANFVGLNAGDSSVRQSDQQALEQLRQKQALQERQIAQQNALEKEKITAQAAAANEERRAALKRVMAAQRANFGASGVGANSTGSVQAVLLGAFEESEDERARREELDRYKTRAIDLSANQQRSINVLQRTQLEEQQRLDRALSSSNSSFFGGLF